MSPFTGFPAGKTPYVALPEAFFRHLLPQIDHLGELKVTLYLFWQLERGEGTFRFVRQRALEEDKRLLATLDESPSVARDLLTESLQRAVERGVFLSADIDLGNGIETVYFLNSPRGRAALEAIRRGKWQPRPAAAAPTPPPPETPNIFRLYEENIGPLTPLLAETLAEAQDTYPPEWIAEAMRLAVERNKRTWRYIAAILDRWQREGRHAQPSQPSPQPDSAEARRKYVEGEYADFVEH